MLTDWINPDYLEPKRIKELKQECKSAKPYPHLYLRNFFLEEKFAPVTKVLTQQHFERRRSDLFTFGQTLLEDPVLKDFVAFYGSEAFRDYVSLITGVKELQWIDATGFCYGDTDHLLPHDDRMPGRKVAYIVYFSKGFTAKDGGQLDLLKKHGVQKSLVPVYNSILLFPVSKHSLHQVREVIGKKKRYTIAGWFYGR